MKIITVLSLFLVSLSLLLVSCGTGSEEFPPEPPAPGEVEGGALAGQVYNAEWVNYANPGTKFILSKDIATIAGTTPDSLSLSVNNEEFVWKKGYVTDVNGQWKEFQFVETAAGGSGWVRGTATKALSISPSEQTEGDNYVVAYSCKRVNNQWDCNGNKWMIQGFTVEKNYCQGDDDCEAEQICEESQCIDLPAPPSVPFQKFTALTSLKFAINYAPFPDPADCSSAGANYVPRSYATIPAHDTVLSTRVVVCVLKGEVTAGTTIVKELNGVTQSTNINPTCLVGNTGSNTYSFNTGKNAKMCYTADTLVRNDVPVTDISLKWNAVSTGPCTATGYEATPASYIYVDSKVSSGTPYLLFCVKKTTYDLNYE